MSETISNAELMFRDISPKWAQRFDQLPLSPLSLKGVSWGLQILFAETCVVGEAYGYSSSYISECAKCSLLGYEFVTSFMTRSYNQLKENQELFVKHWNQEHAHLTRRRRNPERILMLSRLARPIDRII